MNNYIVNESSNNIRKIARGFMAGLWKPAFAAVAVFTLCTELPVIILDELFGFPIESMIGTELAQELGYEGVNVSVVSPLYNLLVIGAFTLGITIFFIEVIRNKNADIGNVFAGFSYYFKALGLIVVQGIIIGLWCLLLIIPGIIAALRYSMAFYILADDPSKGIMQCLRESKIMMKGNKLNFLVMNLSFIGWLLLAGIVVASADMIISSFVDYGFIYNLITCVVLVVAMCGVTAYISAAETVFYEMANGNLRPESDELPPLSQTIIQSQDTPDNNIPVIPEIETNNEDK